MNILFKTLFLLLLITDCHASVLTVGDSLTAGLFRNSSIVFCKATQQTISNTNIPSCRSDGLINRGGWQPKLSQLLNQNVVNHSISSISSTQIKDLYFTVDNRERFKYTIILAGTNDIIAGSSIDTIIENINTIAANVEGTPIVLTIPPIDGRGNRVANNVEVLNDRIRNLNYKVVDIYKYLNDDWQRFNSGDGIHLSDAGNDLIAEKVAQGVKEKIMVIMAPIISLLLES